MPSHSFFAIYTRLIGLLIGGYQASVFRRTVILAGFIVPAFVANFFVYFFGARLLAADQFGLFYVAQTIGNVLFSGALILNIFFTRYFVHVAQAGGDAAVFPAMLRLERAVLTAGFTLSAAILLGLMFAGSYVGVQSRLVLVMIVLDAFTAYVADLGRVLLQSLRRTITLGCYTLVWMVLRLILCVLGLWMFKTVWAGLLGAVLAQVIMFAGFQIWVIVSARGAPRDFPAAPAAWTLLLPLIGYGLMIVVSNMDVLMSYIVLEDHDLGVYSASSVFPKSILVVITPLLQMLLPMMMTGHSRSAESRNVIGKIFGTMLAITLAGVFMTWLLSDWLCGGRWGLAFCDDRLLTILLASAVPLAMLRVMIMLQLAQGRELVMLWLALPLIGYAGAAWMARHTLSSVAAVFTVASAGTLVFFLAVSFIADRGRKPVPA